MPMLRLHFLADYADSHKAGDVADVEEGLARWLVMEGFAEFYGSSQ